jgi:anti-sigma regulatory factor (Ser/Thr protein kinase)
VIVAVNEPSQVGDARRRAADFARAAALAERADAIALVATEMASNLLKHAGGGELVAQRFDDADGSGIELLALDRGPGMENVERSRVDGHSTSGSPGTGLGAIARQADRFRIFSRPGIGSALQARFVATPPARFPAGTPQRHLGAIVAPYPGETESGDAWGFVDAPNGCSVLLADGSGHGPEAARAANTAVAVLQAHGGEDGVRLIERIHRALAASRGAAVALARVDLAAGVLRYVAVGNIAAIMIGAGEMRHLVSSNGTAGHGTPRIREFTYPLADARLLVMHSDGLASRWSLAAYPGLIVQHPGLVAGVLFRDHRRGRDDASVVVLRLAPGEQTLA